MSDVFYSETEYRAAYGQKKTAGAMDKYEEAVERMMQEPFEKNQSTSKSQEEMDPYEAMVQKKMNSKFGNEKSSQTENQSDAQSVKSNASYESQNSHQSSHSNKSKKSVSSHKSSISSGSHLTDANADSLSIEEIENLDYQEIPNYPVRLQIKKKGKEVNVSHLNKKEKQKVKKEETGDIRPVFLRNPEHGTVKEQEHLYGPFYVSWPKNKEMPAQYAELQKVYNNTHYS